MFLRLKHVVVSGNLVHIWFVSLVSTLLWQRERFRTGSELKGAGESFSQENSIVANVTYTVPGPSLLAHTLTRTSGPPRSRRLSAFKPSNPRTLPSLLRAKPRQCHEVPPRSFVSSVVYGIAGATSARFCPN